MEKNLYPNSFIYLWTRFEQQQVQDMYASQNFQVSSILRRPKTHFLHVQGNQRGIAKTGSITKIENTKNTAHEVEHQKTVNKRNMENGLSSFQMLSKSYFITTWGKTRPQDAETWEKIASDWKDFSLSIWYESSLSLSFSRFLFKMFWVTFRFSPIRSFSRFFFLRFCLQEFGPSQF